LQVKATKGENLLKEKLKSRDGDRTQRKGAHRPTSKKVWNETAKGGEPPKKERKPQTILHRGGGPRRKLYQTCGR